MPTDPYDDLPVLKRTDTKAPSVDPVASGPQAESPDYAQVAKEGAKQGIVDAARSLSTMSPGLFLAMHPKETLQFLANHPTISKILGGAGGTLAGLPGGPAAMIAGGAAGTSIADSASQLAQMGTPDAPKSAADAALRSGGAVLEGGLTGAAGAGTVGGAPTVLRALASPAGQAAVSGAGTLATTKSPKAAVKAAATALLFGKASGLAGGIARKGGAIADALEEAIAAARAKGVPLPKALEQIPMPNSGGVTSTLSSVLPFPHPNVTSSAPVQAAAAAQQVATAPASMPMPPPPTSILSPEATAQRLAMRAPAPAMSAPPPAAPQQSPGAQLVQALGPDQQLATITRLKHIYESSDANKSQVLEVAKQAFPDNWKEVMEMIKAPLFTTKISGGRY